MKPRGLLWILFRTIIQNHAMEFFVDCISKEISSGETGHGFLGSIFDVIVDIRSGSSTFGKWYGVELTQENQWQLWISPGLAHGFAVTSEVAHFHYKCTEIYHPEDEYSICWNDAELNIAWPISQPQLSAKDNAAPSFAEIKHQFGM